MIEAVMPEGVEHFETGDGVFALHRVIEAVMPEGVEHLVGNRYVSGLRARGDRGGDAGRR